jgi:hypothetical protein
MSDADSTPIDGRSPLELILDGVNQTRTTQLAMYEDLKAYRQEQQGVQADIAALKRERWTPVLVSVCAALFCLGCVFAIVQP